MAYSPFLINYMDPPEDAPSDDDSLVQMCERLFEVASRARKPAEEDVITNCLYLAGEQWQRIKTDLEMYRRTEVHAPHTLARITDNQVMPMCRQVQSTLIAGIARQDAIAVDNSPKAQRAAHISTSFLEDRYYTDREKKLRESEAMWAMVAGECLRRTYWDVNGGRFGASGEGDIVTETINFFKYFKPPWQDADEDPEWIIEADIRDVDEIKELFDKEVQPEETSKSGIDTDKILMTVIDGDTPFAPNRTPDKRKHAAILKSLYVAPTPKRPKGRLVIWANQTLLRETELPDGFLPFVKIQWLNIPGRMYPLSMVSNLRPLQKQYNIKLSQLVELTNRQLRGDIFIKGSGKLTFTQDKLTGAKIVRADEGVQDWDFIKYTLNSQDSEILRQSILSDMRVVGGANDPTLGVQAKGDHTLGELEILKGSDQRGAGMFADGFNDSYCEVSTQKLLLAGEHIKNQRPIRIMGGSNTVKDTITFYGKDLAGTKDVRPRTMPLLSEPQIHQMRLQAAQNGLFGPYQGPEDELAKKLTYLNMGIPDAEDEIDSIGTPMDLLKQIVSQIYQERAKMDALQTHMRLQLMLNPNTVLQAALAAGAQLPQGPTMPVPNPSVAPLTIGPPGAPPPPGAPQGPSPRPTPGPQPAMA